MAATVPSAAVFEAATAARGWQPVADLARTSLGTSAFEAAWARGAHVDRDGAVALVTAELDAVEVELANSG